MARDFQNDDEPPTGAEAALETRVAAFEDCGTLTAASASTGAINLLGGKVRRGPSRSLPAGEGGGARSLKRRSSRGGVVGDPNSPPTPIPSGDSELARAGPV